MRYLNWSSLRSSDAALRCSLIFRYYAAAFLIPCSLVFR